MIIKAKMPVFLIIFVHVNTALDSPYELKMRCHEVNFNRAPPPFDCLNSSKTAP